MDKDTIICATIIDPDGTVEVNRQDFVPRPSAYAVILKNTFFLLMIRGRVNGRLSMPGGGVEHNESYVMTLRREIPEETGLILTTIEYWASFENFVFYEPHLVAWHVILQIFRCEVEDLDKPLTSAGNPDQDEGEPEWVDLRTVQPQELQNINRAIVAKLQRELRLR